MVYGSESESSNESDEEHHSSGYKQTSKLDSDEAIQVNSIFEVQLIQLLIYPKCFFDNVRKEY